MVIQRLEDPVRLHITAVTSNTHKPLSHRLTLNIKGLPYTNEWVEFPDIEALCKKLGLPPDRVLPNGTPVYTVPVIYDPNTDSHHVESKAIAKYLDGAYPDTPQLFPPGTQALQTAFIELGWNLAANNALINSLGPATEKWLNPSSAVFWRKTREERTGKTMEAVATEAEWRALERGMHALKEIIEGGGKGDGFFTGDKPVMADIVIAGALLWMKVVDGSGWAKIAALDGGWWDRYMDRFAPYSVMPTL